MLNQTIHTRSRAVIRRIVCTFLCLCMVCFAFLLALQQRPAEEVEAALGEEGRLLLRESGTEPLIRVMVEAKTDEICRENVDKIVDALRAGGHERTE